MPPIAYLLNIEHPDQIASHYLRGGLFENLVIADVLKWYYNQGKRAPLYFWKDKSGKEIDLLIDKTDRQMSAIEIKSGVTATPDYFRNFSYFNRVSGSAQHPLVIYAGERKWNSKDGEYVPFGVYEEVVFAST